MTSATIQVPRRRIARWFDNFATHHGEPATEVHDDEVTLTAPDGAIAVVRVPFGPLPEGDDPCAAVVAHLAIDRRIGALLVRRGGHAVGIFDGDRLVASKVGQSYVQSRTKAGGWSQQRYARRRANQADQAADKATEDAVRILLGEDGAELAALVCGGDRELCEQVLSDRRLREAAELWSPKIVHPVPDPRLRVLQDFGDHCTAARISLNDAALAIGRQ